MCEALRPMVGVAGCAVPSVFPPLRKNQRTHRVHVPLQKPRTYQTALEVARSLVLPGPDSHIDVELVTGQRQEGPGGNLPMQGGAFGLGLGFTKQARPDRSSGSGDAASVGRTRRFEKRSEEKGRGLGLGSLSEAGEVR